MCECTMCEAAPATTTYGFAVCQPCADAMIKLDAELKRVEANDPTLAKLAKEINGMVEEYLKVTW